MIRSVTWISESELPCSPTANVILCTTGFTLPAQLVDVFESSCPNEFVYSFTYDDTELPENHLDNYGPLSDTDINEVICEDCFTQWVEEQVDKAFEFVLEAGEDGNASGDDVVLPSAGPLIVNGGNGIDIALIQPNQLWIGMLLSTDSDNALVLGSDHNPYVAPFHFPLDGWYQLEDYEDWSYASANTINVPAGALLRYAKGDKIKIVQLGSSKYFVVQAVADTLLTVQGGSDYTVSNNPIQGAFLSKDVTPVGFPSSFNFTSTIGGFSVLPTHLQKISINGRRVRIDVQATAPGTSNATHFTMTTPIPAESGGPKFISGGGQGEDGGIYQENVFAEIPAGSTTITLSREGGSFTWTAAGDKYANFNLEYYF